MKKFGFFRFLAVAVILLTVLLSTSAFAENSTQHKVLFTYNSEDSTLDMDIYISKGTAIVGYCSFEYDTNLLTLTDKNLNRVPDEITDTETLYLTKVVDAKNGVVVTDINKGSKNLINTKDGYFLFAWYLPEAIDCIDADKDGEKCIASVKFLVNEGFDKQSLTENPSFVKPAPKSITNKVSGWFPGLIVMNASGKQYSFDAEKENKDLFVAFLDTAELDSFGENVHGSGEENTEENTEDNTEENTENKENSEETDQENSGEKDDETNTGNTDEAPDENPDEAPDEIPDENPDEAPDEAPDENPDEAPDKNDNTDDETNKDDDGQDSEDDENQQPPTVTTPHNKALGNAFQLSFPFIDDNSLRVMWTFSDEEFVFTSEYNVILCDEEYDVVSKKVLDTSSGSCTFYNLMPDTLYRVYLYSTEGDTTYSSRIFDVKTLTYEGDGIPDAVVFNVIYAGGGGTLYGLTSEKVLYGKTPTKTPDVYAPKNKYFLGWTCDGETLVDIQEYKIYADTTFTAVFSKEKPEEFRGYIKGDAGTFTFRPEDGIKRSEAAAIIARISNGFAENKIYPHAHAFDDIQPGAWYNVYVDFCVNRGYLNGYTNGDGTESFKPDSFITRAEFATLLSRYFALDEYAAINVFDDVKDDFWAKDYISSLFSAGAVLPDDDKNFRPSENLKRKDAVKMINACLGVIPQRDAIDKSNKENGTPFTDVPYYSEYFYDIIAALQK